MSDPAPLTDVPAPVSCTTEPTPAVEEVDLWWGGYSGWALVPGIVLCLALTGLIGVGTWAWMHRGWMQLAFLGLGSALWLVQGLRWGHRYFSFSYRLTTRRLFYEAGFWAPERLQVDLAHIAGVAIKQNSLEKILHVGRIVLCLEGHAPKPLVLGGVRHPHEIAAFLRERAHKSRNP